MPTTKILVLEAAQATAAALPQDPMKFLSGAIGLMVPVVLNGDAATWGCPKLDAGFQGLSRALLYIYIYIHICIHTYMCTSHTQESIVCTYVYIYIDIDMQTCIYNYVYIYICG